MMQAPRTSRLGALMATVTSAAPSVAVVLAAVVAVVVVASIVGCRIEVGAPSGPAVASAATDVPAGKVVLYTSAYRDVVDALVALQKTQLPDVELVVFQGGSEKVASRLDADLAAGRAQADVLLVSDPLLYRRLKADGQLLPYASPRATPIDRRLADVDNAFVGARASTMVIAFHRENTPAQTAPQALRAALFDEAIAKDIAFGDPLSSGTAMFTSLLVSHGEVNFLQDLRARGASVAGGNAVVIQRILSGERRFGVVLLENVLLSSARGEPLDFVIPTDAVVIPGDVAILKDTANAVAARAIVDLILSPEGQALMRGAQGMMHATDPRLEPPDPRVPPLSALLDRQPLDEPLLATVARDRAGLLGRIEAALMHQP
jgi:iron(III) transport system substrate-binding protein